MKGRICKRRCLEIATWNSEEQWIWKNKLKENKVISVLMKMKNLTLMKIMKVIKLSQKTSLKKTRHH